MEILISGASTGIGRAVAVHMAGLGHKVWAGVRTQKSFSELDKTNIRGLQPIFLDVTDPASIATAMSLIKKKAGTLNALVNNAGVAIGGPVEALEVDDWRRQFEVNFFGVIQLTKACLPLLRESRGRVVNMSSVSGRIAVPYLSPYAASKFALEAYSDSLRREMRHRGVKVSVIEPGAIKTPIWKKSIGTSTEQFANMSDEMRDLYGASVQRFFKALHNAEVGAAPVALVVKSVEHALCARMPRTRYPVGRGIGLLTGVSTALPDSWMDRMLNRLI